MSITDYVQNVCDACVSILTADTELRALFGRTTQLVAPWEAFDDDTPLPVLLYTPVTHGPVYTGVASLLLQFTAFGSTRDVANKAVARVPLALTYAAFAARSLEVARDPANLPQRGWPAADPLLGDMALARADIGLSFLIPG